MPWTRKQIDTARAIEHGWKGKGSANGFGQKFAGEVIAETDNGKDKAMVRRQVAESKMGKGAHAASKR
jgi:hypothetical protein